MVEENADKSGSGRNWSECQRDLRVRLCSFHEYGKSTDEYADLTLAMQLPACCLTLVYL